ncbi:MAG: hypothetical protein ABR987_12630 [Terracidiphilus sp.]|jgi:hypothetical protein
MQQPATTKPSPTFAGILSSLAEPGRKRPPVRDLDGLDDDVATFSYERALRAHSRFRKPDPPESIDHLDDRALTQPAPSKPLRIHEVFPADLEPAAETAPEPARSAWVADPEPEAAHEISPAHDRNLKSASITIRLSKGECAQLRQRAAEAGLTISAYLRSCTVEADLLRAQVKDTLAQMRAEAPKENQEAAPAVPEPRFGWLLRFWPREHARRRIAQA